MTQIARDILEALPIEIAEGSSGLVPESLTETEIVSRLDALAIKLMQSRPELDEMSLDEWLAEHHEQLSSDERKAASAIIDAYMA